MILLFDYAKPHIMRTSLAPRQLILNALRLVASAALLIEGISHYKDDGEKKFIPFKKYINLFNYIGKLILFFLLNSK